MSKAEGKKIGIKFTLPLVGDVSGNQGAFTVTGKEYQYTDGPDNNGVLFNKTYQVESVERYPTTKLYQDNFDSGVMEDVEIRTGGIVLAVGGGGVGYTDDLTSGLSYISTSDFSSAYAKHMAFDDSTSSSWSATGTVGQAVGVDFGLGKKISKLRIMTNGRLRNFDLEGSNDNSTWAIVYSGTQLSNSNWQEYVFENFVGYRYYRVKCTGPLYTGSNVMITEIEMMESLLVYVGEGNYTNDVPMQNNGQFRLGWVENKPTDTDIFIEYASGETQGQWQEAANGGIINVDTNLWIRATLSTTDTSVTPTLQDLWIEEPDAPQDKILIEFTDWFRKVQGPLTISYNQALGNLSGTGGAVASFTEVFTPTDLEEGLTATGGGYGTHEHIEASVVGSIDLLYIEKISTEPINEYVSASISGTVELINIDDINP